jgi:predicted RNase H-like HicB family nuclease
MDKKTLHAVIYKDAGSDQWVASCIEYDIATVGDSEEHALAMIQEAAQLHLEDIEEAQLEDIDNEVGSSPVVRSFKISAPSILKR